MSYHYVFVVMQHGACVNVADLWKFTPLHEAAAKGKFEICRLLLKVRTEVWYCDNWPWKTDLLPMNWTFQNVAVVIFDYFVT